MNSVELTLDDTPENVLGRISAPAEVRRVPSEEVAGPVVEKVPILRVARAPAPRDRIAGEIHVDAAAPRLLHELRVGSSRVLVAAGDRLSAVLGVRHAHHHRQK